MVEFVSITAHAATVYLHALLARHQYASRRENFALYVFWLMMVLFVGLHSGYAIKIFAGELGAQTLMYRADTAALVLLLLCPPVIVPVVFEGLTRTRDDASVLARTLAGIGRHVRFATGASLTVSLVSIPLALLTLPGAEQYQGSLHAGLYSMWHAFGLGFVWLVTWLSGVRYARSYSGLGRACGVLFLFLLAFYLVTSLMIDIGRYWSLIPLVSTIGFSLVFSWYRFRFQFVDVVLRRLFQYLIALAALISLTGLWPLVEAAPLSLKLLVVLAWLLLTSSALGQASRWLEHLWLPGAQHLARLNLDLARELASCTTRAEAIEKTEARLSATFHADIRINRAHDTGADEVRVDDTLTLHLGYVHGWMPWLSQGVAATRSAGLVLHSHLVLLETLAEAQRHALNSQHLSELAARAELAAMHARIRPHFLFNTLNTIHGFVREQPEAAERTIELLAELMRGAVQQSDSDLTTLDRELSMTEAYLEIQRMRHGDALRFTVQASEESRAAELPPFSVQPLVENAIKFALETRGGVAEVAVDCALIEQRLSVTVADNGPGLGRTSSDGLGTAVGNIRERLQRLFGDAAALTLKDRPTGGVEAHLVTPWPAR